MDSKVFSCLLGVEGHYCHASASGVAVVTLDIANRHTSSWDLASITHVRWHMLLSIRWQILLGAKAPSRYVYYLTDYLSRDAIVQEWNFLLAITRANRIYVIDKCANRNRIARLIRRPRLCQRRLAKSLLECQRDNNLQSSNLPEADTTPIVSLHCFRSFL